MPFKGPFNRVNRDRTGSSPESEKHIFPDLVEGCRFFQVQLNFPCKFVCTTSWKGLRGNNMANAWRIETIFVSVCDGI